MERRRGGSWVGEGADVLEGTKGTEGGEESEEGDGEEGKGDATDSWDKGSGTSVLEEGGDDTGL